MTKSMQHLKISDTTLLRMRVNHNRIKSQLEAMGESPTAYRGETLKSAIGVMLWHIYDQEAYLDYLEHKTGKINQLIDQADTIYQGAENG